SGQFGIGEHAERHQTILSRAIAAVEVVMHDAEIVESDMGKLRAAGAIAHRPDMVGGSLPSLVHLNITVLVEFDSGLLESDSVGVCRPASSDEQIGAFEGWALGS